MSNYLTTIFYGINDEKEFFDGIQKAIDQIDAKDGIYTGDNLIAINRNLSFLDDPALMKAFSTHTAALEKSVLWRISTVLRGVRNGMKLEGDLVECACYKGTTVRVICDVVGFSDQVSRHYYLYDLFDHDPNMPHHSMPEHCKKLFSETKARFADCQNVTVTQGKVPDVLADVSPEKIAFMHLDLNNAEAEIGALEVLFERMVPGALLVLDDYGWLAYRPQKLALDPWFEKRGYQVLELPTGQGLLIK